MRGEHRSANTCALLAAGAATIVLGLISAPLSAEASDGDGSLDPGRSFSGGIFTGTNPVEVAGPIGLWARTGTAPVPAPITTGTSAGTVVDVPVRQIRTSTTVGETHVPVTLVLGAQNDAADPAAPPVPAELRTDRPTGRPGSVVLHVWSDGAYPSADRTLTSIPVSVTAVDTDGSPLDVRGAATVTAPNGTGIATAYSGPNGTATFLADTTDLAVGAGTLTVTVTGSHSPTPVAVTVQVTLRETSISQVTADLPFSTVYPQAVGYHDRLSISLRSATSTGKAITARGTAEILRNGVPVARWTITSSTQTMTWGGHVHGRLLPGTYVLKVRMKGAEGRVRTTSRVLLVSKKTLVEHTKVVQFTQVGEHGEQKPVTVSAEHGHVRCTLTVMKVHCSADRSVSGASSRIALPSLPLPAYVVASEQYRAAEVRAVSTIASLHGRPRWIVPGHPGVDVVAGTSTSAWFRLMRGATLHKVWVQLGRAGSFDLLLSEIQYRYVTLE